MNYEDIYKNIGNFIYRFFSCSYSIFLQENSMFHIL